MKEEVIKPRKQYLTIIKILIELKKFRGYKLADNTIKNLKNNDKLKIC